MSEKNNQIIEDDPFKVRLNKRNALIDAGENPYGQSFEYSHHICDLAEKYSGIEDGRITEDRATIAGRILSKRAQGKVCFMGIRDASGDMQLFCRINNLGEDEYAKVKDLDVGD